MAKLHVRYMVGGHARGIDRRTPVPLRVSRTPRRAAQVPARHRHAVEHHAVPLSQSRLRLRPRARRRADSADRERRFRPARARAEVRVRGGDRQSGVPDVPGRGWCDSAACLLGRRLTIAESLRAHLLGQRASSPWAFTRIGIAVAQQRRRFIVSVAWRARTAPQRAVRRGERRAVGRQRFRRRSLVARRSVCSASWTRPCSSWRGPGPDRAEATYG